MRRLIRSSSKKVFRDVHVSGAKTNRTQLRTTSANGYRYHQHGGAHMSRWTYWEWIAYSGLFVAAILIAADQG
jgi:hypothetical protein